MTVGLKSNSEEPVVLIIGASAGIGLALVKRLLAWSWRVVATLRASSLYRFSEAGIVGGPQCMIRPLALPSEKEARIIIREVKERCGGVEMLINNAGVSYRAVSEHAGTKPRRFSVGVMMAMPTMAVYSDSKFTLERASEGLWYELKL